MSGMQNTQKAKPMDILVEFLIGFLQQNLCSTSVFCTLLYIRRRVQEDPNSI